jgi:hypothetical protein
MMMLVNLAKANNINKLPSYGDELDNDGNKFHKDDVFQNAGMCFQNEKISWIRWLQLG